MFKPVFRWEVLKATQVCQGQGISFPAIMQTSRGLHKVAQEKSRGLVLLGFAIRLQFRRHGYAANFNRAATEKSLTPFLNIGGR